jgi:hypothetical protein
MEERKQGLGPDEMYCWSCGSVVKRDAELCMSCGVRVQRAAAPARKDRAVAILLAVFLGFWTWLYTYKRDAWKFWLGLGLNLTVFNPAWTWLIFFSPNIALWIWAIVDAAVKPREFYESY